MKNLQKSRIKKDTRVLVRCDFDVPLKSNKIIDDQRLINLLPTLNYLIKKRAKLILIGHAGRPQGKAVKAPSLRPIKNRLEKLLNANIEFIKTDRYISKNIQEQVNNSQSNVVILENLRFSDRERANCKRFAKNLSNLADIYVNESFANSHRAHASMDAIQKYLPSYLGLHTQLEIENLKPLLKKPKQSLVLIIGGAKTKTKIPVIQKFLPHAQYILLGGVIANTFLKALGYNTGKSKIDKDYLNQAKNILAKDQAKIFLPVDKTIMSLALPIMVKKQSSSMNPKSPV